MMIPSPEKMPSLMKIPSLMKMPAEGRRFVAEETAETREDEDAVAELLMMMMFTEVQALRKNPRTVSFPNPCRLSSKPSNPFLLLLHFPLLNLTQLDPLIFTKPKLTHSN
ncbi:hypothetical protein Hanom_Chr05g00451851 [Helianthus anomalus]